MDSNFIEYCIDEGILDQAGLKNALAQKAVGESLYQAIIRSGISTQEQLAIAAGDFYHCQVVDLSRVTPDAKALSYGSASVCRRFGFVPFAVDPVAGVLVALADYTQVEAISAFLRDARVERMKFYIAPLQTLLSVIQNCYGADILPEISSNQVNVVGSRRRPSILHTQYVEMDNAVNLSDVTAGHADHKIQALAAELNNCKDENTLLRQRVEQLSATLELEASLLRELAKVLKSTGVLDGQSFERWLAAQR